MWAAFRDGNTELVVKPGDGVDVERSGEEIAEKVVGMVVGVNDGEVVRLRDK